MSLGDCPRRFTKEEIIARLKGGETLKVDRVDAPELDDLFDLVAEGVVVPIYVLYDEQSSALKFCWKTKTKHALRPETLRFIQHLIDGARKALQRGDQIEHARHVRLATQCIADAGQMKEGNGEPDLAQAFKGIMHHCDFFNSAFNGMPMNDTDRPVLLGNGNIAWPKGWTVEMAAMYRRTYGLSAPGE